MRTLLSHLFSLFDTAVLARQADGQFALVSECPTWLQHFVPTAPEAPDIFVLQGCFNFLDHFLEEADAHWAKGEETPIRSGTWVEVDMAGREWAFEASAVTVEGTPILQFQHLGETYQDQVTTLQKARENLLTREYLEEEVSRRTLQVRQREEEVAMRLLGAAGMRDEETGTHVRRIGLYSATMAKTLGWDMQRVDDIRIAAPMHDIGKIGVPDRILLKPGRLTPAEFAVMQRHVEIGAQMLEGGDIPLLEMAREIALCHHERWDGSGYPRGLCEAAIPESARIVAIADTYDALVHARVYKPAFSEQETLSLMQEQSGKHYDPDMFSLFMDVLPEVRRIRDEIKEEPVPWDMDIR